MYFSVILPGLSYRQMYRKFKKVVSGLLVHARSEALVYKSYFSEEPFYGNYSTLDSHTNTVISHAFAYS